MLWFGIFILNLLYSSQAEKGEDFGLGEIQVSNILIFTTAIIFVVPNKADTNNIGSSTQLIVWHISPRLIRCTLQSYSYNERRG